MRGRWQPNQRRRSLVQRPRHRSRISINCQEAKKARIDRPAMAGCARLNSIFFKKKTARGRATANVQSRSLRLHWLAKIASAGCLALRGAVRKRRIGRGTHEKRHKFERSVNSHSEARSWRRRIQTKSNSKTVLDLVLGEDSFPPLRISDHKARN